MDLAALDAIDVHVHVEQDGHGCFSLDQELMDASAKYFRADQDRTPTVATIAEHYRARRAARRRSRSARCGTAPAPAAPAARRTGGRSGRRWARTPAGWGGT